MSSPWFQVPDRSNNPFLLCECARPTAPLFYALLLVIPVGRDGTGHRHRF